MSREVTPTTEYQSKSIAGWQINVKGMANALREQFKLAEAIRDKQKKKERIDHLNTAKKSFNKLKKGKILSWRTNGRRVSNPVVKLERSMRKFVSGKKYKLVEIDCANSHPLLLAHKFLCDDIQVEADLLDRVKTNRFYELFSSDRDKAKKMCFSFFYNKKEVNTRHPAYRVLNRHFPDFTQAIVNASRRGSLAEMMQAHESTIWIDKISTTCRYAGIKHCTTHDGVVFEHSGNGQINKVETLVRDAFGDIAPYLHIKYLGEEESLEYVFQEVPEMHHYSEMVRMQLGEIEMDPDILPGMEEVSRYYFAIGFISFWTPVNKKDPGFGFQDADVIAFLKKKGYRMISQVDRPMYVRIMDNIFEEVTDPDIRKQMSSFIEGLEDTLFGISKKTVLNAFHAKTGKGLSLNAHYAYLPDIVKELERTRPDRKDVAFIPFRNGVVRLQYDADGEELHRSLIPFPNVKHWVWKDAIRQVDYLMVEDAADKSDIAHFLYRITGDKLSEIEARPEEFQEGLMEKKTEDFYNMMRTVGYMIHMHKDPARARGIIILDRNLEMGTRGGAGKSLLVQCLGVLRNVVEPDGQEKDKRWLLDKVTRSTEIVAIEDMHKNYPMGGLNNTITGDMYVNPKMGKKMLLPFAVSPKLIGTTNFMIDFLVPGVDRRWIVIEINNHYSKQHTPLDELGHRLIDDWDAEQLNVELNFLMQCIEAYLENGLPEDMVTDAKEKMLKDSIGEDFYDAFSELVPEWRAKAVPRFRTFELVRQVYEYLGLDTDFNLTEELQKRFAPALKKYCEALDIPVVYKTVRRRIGENEERFKGWVFSA